jgi:hypothetical protein
MGTAILNLDLTCFVRFQEMKNISGNSSYRGVEWGDEGVSVL